MKAIIYLINTGLSILLGIFILRFIMQITKTDFRNPIAQIITKVSNPIILPLRKVIPPIKKIDTATIIATLVVSISMVLIMLSLRGISLASLFNDPVSLVILSLRNILSLTLTIYWVLILFSVIISWIQPNNYSPFTSFLHQLTEPVLAPVRRLLPPIGGLDITPIPVLILLTALQQQFGMSL